MMMFFDNIGNIRHTLQTYNIQSTTLAERTLIPRMMKRTPISIIINNINHPSYTLQPLHQPTLLSTGSRIQSGSSLDIAYSSAPTDWHCVHWACFILCICCTGTLLPYCNSQFQSLTIPYNSVGSRFPAEEYRPVMGLHTLNVLPYHNLSLTALA